MIQSDSVDGSNVGDILLAKGDMEAARSTATASAAILRKQMPQRVKQLETDSSKQTCKSLLGSGKSAEYGSQNFAAPREKRRVKDTLP